jgi:hypothetical protein
MRIYLEIFSFIDENLFSRDKYYIIEIQEKIKLFEIFFNIYREINEDRAINEKFKIPFRNALQYFNDYKLYINSLTYSINKIKKNLLKLDEYDKNSLYNFCINRSIEDIKITIKKQGQRINCFDRKCEIDHFFEIMDKIALYMDVYTIAKILNDNPKKDTIYLYYSGGKHSENIYNFFNEYKKNEFDIISKIKVDYNYNINFTKNDLSKLASVL